MLEDNVRKGDAAVQSDGHKGLGWLGSEDRGEGAVQWMGMYEVADMTSQPWSKEDEGLLGEASAHGIVVGGFATVQYFLINELS